MQRRSIRYRVTGALALGLLALSGCARQTPRAPIATLERGAEVSIPATPTAVDRGRTTTVDVAALDATSNAGVDGGIDVGGDATASDSGADVLVEPPSRSSDAARSASCATDADCVLVTGGCQGPMAAHRDEAAAIDAQNQRLLSVATCDGRFAARPVRPVCAQSRCVLEPMDHPEWRLCASARECRPVHRNCQHWQAINRRFEREARDAMRLSRPCGPSVVPPPPRIECRYGWCVTGWSGR
jgi:hypothetical protein